MEYGLLILRVVVGALFVGHGAQKLFGWFGGHGLRGTGGFFESIGYRPGVAMALVAGATEAGAGLLLGFGFLTPLAAAAIIGVMINAYVSVKRPMGLFSGYEIDLVYATVAAAIAFTGAGAYSIDAALGWSFDGATWGLGALALGIVTAGLTLVARRTAQAQPVPVAADPRTA